MDPGLRIPAAHPSRGSADAHDPRHARSGRDGLDRFPRRAQPATCSTCRAAWCTRRSSATPARDQLDVFWPVRPDYVERAAETAGALRAGGGAGREAEEARRRVHVHRRADLAEGQAVLLGHVLPESRPPNDWTGSPARSRLIVDGAGWQVARALDAACSRTARWPRGTAICSSATCSATASSRWTRRPDACVRVVLDKVNGKPIDGPNDLVMDAKGGLYITDPQFTPEARRASRASRCTTSRRTARRSVVIGPGEYAMPNGVELSPDGKTLYVNNTWPQPGENFVWAYDVAADGSLSNKRQFAMLNLTPDVLERGQSRRPLRFAAPTARRWTRMAGITWPPRAASRSSCPTAPMPARSGCRSIPSASRSAAPNNDVLYMVGESSAWAIQTKVRGFRHPRGHELTTGGSP